VEVAPAEAVTTPEADVLVDAVRNLIDRTGWSMKVGEPWAHVAPTGVTLPDQGWKLHVSATEESAADVLGAVVPVLMAEGATFKFAAGVRYVRVLNSAGADRASSGKFLTVYPTDDDQARRIAAAAHTATGGLAGPVILSDRPYRPGSLVHYRYGGFTGRYAIDGDGLVVHLLRTPDGDLVADERRPGYAAPAWAADPFQPPPAPGGGAGAPADAAMSRQAKSHGHSATPVAPGGGAGAPADAAMSRQAKSHVHSILLNDRYLVTAALAHANKGGTYLATDHHTGQTVVVKEGRPHVATTAGGDARYAIRHEARMLEMAGHLGHTPRLVDVFDQGGHTFLVEEHIDAGGLRDLVDPAYEPPGAGLPASTVRALALALADIVADFHAAGVVLRDFTPNNLLVTDEGGVVLIDLELAHPAGEAPAAAAGTPGYAAPGQLTGRPSGFPDDYWSLGATIAYLATGADPFLPADVSHSWTDPGRLAAWLDDHVASGTLQPAVAGVVAAAMDPDPSRRPTPAGLARALTGASAAPTRPVRPTDADPPDLATVAAGVAHWLCTRLGTGPAGHLWPTGPNGSPLDPVNVQSGASGVGLFLARAAEVMDDDHALRKPLAATAAWVSQQVADGPPRPPGLYFGLSGVAWFLTDAAAVLGRDDLLRRANELALSLPVPGVRGVPDMTGVRGVPDMTGVRGVPDMTGVRGVPDMTGENPDLSHGTAGVGLGQLHQWLRTGDDRFLARAVLGAEHLVRTVERTDDGPIWRVPASARSRLAGTASYGYAHGTAGIATFLLFVAAATDEEEFATLATDALDGLLVLAQEGADGTAWWPAGPDDPACWPHWCNGSSGVGTALVRAHAWTGQRRYLNTAIAAARAGLAERWRSSPVQCHGLAGDAELLLDLAACTGEEGYRSLARQAAASLWLRRRNEGGSPGVRGVPENTGVRGVPENTGVRGVPENTGVRGVPESFWVFPDDTGGAVSAAFGTGMAGVGSFFLRLAAGGPRPFTLDELLPLARSSKSRRSRTSA
jgi:hypothetical protein